MLASSSSASWALCWASHSLKRLAAAAWKASSASSAGASAAAALASSGSSGAALPSSAGACLRFLLLDFCGSGELRLNITPQHPVFSWSPDSCNTQRSVQITGQI